MASVKQRIAGAVDTARADHPVLDHAVLAVQHFGRVKAGIQASGITYAAFLSFFPILALGFAVVGLVSGFLPADADAKTTLVDAIDSVFPGLVAAPGMGDTLPNAIPIETFEDAAPAILSVGLPLALWSGLGWLSTMRTALLVTFELPEDEQPNFVFGKLRDLLALITLGLTLMVAVAVSGVVSALARDLLGLVDLEELSLLLKLLVPLLGIAANTVLFLAMFRLLARPDLSTGVLLRAALIGGVGFEVLKVGAVYLLGATASSPAFQAFGIALVLVVWIHYFAQLLLFCASWAATAAGDTAPAPVAEPSDPSGRERAAEERVAPATAAALGAGAAVAGLVVVRRLVRR